jgi:restriction system protein
MKKYYRIMLGQKSIHAADGFAGNFIGADFRINEDLSGKLPEQWRDFNKVYTRSTLKITLTRPRLQQG